MIPLLGIIAQLSIVAHAPDSASACDAIELSVAVSAPGRALPRLTLPSFGPFEILRSSPFPHITFDPRGGGSIVAEYRYVIATDRTGTVQIAPFEARLGTGIARSRPVAIAIRSSSDRNAVPTVVARARVDTSFDVDVRALTRAETVYVGQQANYEVAVFLNRTVRDRLRRNPTFFPPDMQSMLAYDLPANDDAVHPRTGSRCFDALVYQRALFPLMPGRVVIPPAQLVYSLPLSAGFFSREETHELQTDSTVIVAVDPPSADRPADYGGAVGDLRLAARLDTAGSRVGDPLLLTVRVAGTGNVKLLPRPRVAIPWATLVNGDERVAVDSVKRKITGTKEFDWVVTPRIAGELDVPPIRYPYFNPDAGRYEVASTSASRVIVGPGLLATADTTGPNAILALRPRYRGPTSIPVHERPVFWVLLALAPIPALSLRRTRRSPTDGATAAARGRTREMEWVGSMEPTVLRRSFISAMAARHRFSGESFTRPGALARSLRRRGVSSQTASEAEYFLRQLDEAAFSRHGLLPEGAAERATALLRAADAQALPVEDLSRGATMLTIALLLAAGAVHAARLDRARTMFDAGVTAYGRHQYTTARDAFFYVVREEPRAADAWANAGTASWALDDTARSVVAWQRAVRLEPLATDVRDRVEIVHALPFTASGFTPPIPASWLFDLAAVWWLMAWGLAAWRARRDRAASSRRTIGLVLTAVATVVAAFVLSDQQAGRQLGVVRHTVGLRADPTFGAESGPAALTGEVVRVTGKQGAWSHVRLDDGREGWIDSAALISLDIRDVDALSSD